MVNNSHKIHTIQTLYIEVTRLQHAFSTFSKGQGEWETNGKEVGGMRKRLERRSLRSEELERD